MIQSPETLNISTDGLGNALIVIRCHGKTATAKLGPELISRVIDTLQFIQSADSSELIQRTDIIERAEKLRDQVKLTWKPPYRTGKESLADSAQTSAMLSLAFVFGKDFLGELTYPQEAAIDAGLLALQYAFSEQSCQDQQT